MSSELSDLLGALPRKDLQRLAKSIGVKVSINHNRACATTHDATQANGKSAEIVALLIDAHDAAPSKFTSTAEVAELLPGWQPAQPTEDAQAMDTSEDNNNTPSQPDTALSPLPDTSAVQTAPDVAVQPIVSEPADEPALQNNPLFDEAQPPQTATPIAASGKENSVPAQATPVQLTEEAMRRAYEKGTQWTE